MARYQQGEYECFEELYARHSGRVYAYFKNKMHAPGEAEDLLQQAFLRLHQSRQRYDATFPLLPWIYAIARNLLVDHVRKHRAIPMENETLFALADKVEHGEKADGAANWDEILKLLSEEQRKLIQLRFVEGLSFEDIAKMNGLSETSTRKRLSRTIQLLRLKLSGKGNRS